MRARGQYRAVQLMYGHRFETCGGEQVHERVGAGVAGGMDRRQAATRDPGFECGERLADNQFARFDTAAYPDRCLFALGAAADHGCICPFDSVREYDLTARTKPTGESAERFNMRCKRHMTEEAMDNDDIDGARGFVNGEVDGFGCDS